MHQDAVLANEVDVFVVDFEVENGLRAGAGEFLLDDFDVAAERLQSLGSASPNIFRFEVFGFRRIAGVQGRVPVRCDRFASLAFCCLLLWSGHGGLTPSRSPGR